MSLHEACVLAGDIVHSVENSCPGKMQIKRSLLKSDLNRHLNPVRAAIVEHAEDYCTAVPVFIITENV